MRLFVVKFLRRTISMYELIRSDQMVQLRDLNRSSYKNIRPSVPRLLPNAYRHSLFQPTTSRLVLASKISMLVSLNSGGSKSTSTIASLLSRTCRPPKGHVEECILEMHPSTDDADFHISVVGVHLGTGLAHSDSESESLECISHAWNDR